jgi:hypothetical protein
MNTQKNPPPIPRPPYPRTQQTGESPIPFLPKPTFHPYPCSHVDIYSLTCSRLCSQVGLYFLYYIGRRCDRERAPAASSVRPGSPSGPNGPPTISSLTQVRVQVNLAQAHFPPRSVLACGHLLADMLASVLASESFIPLGGA